MFKSACAYRRDSAPWDAGQPVTERTGEVDCPACRLTTMFRRAAGLPDACAGCGGRPVAGDPTTGLAWSGGDLFCCGCGAI